VALSHQLPLFHQRWWLGLLPSVLSESDEPWVRTARAVNWLFFMCVGSTHQGRFTFRLIRSTSTSTRVRLALPHQPPWDLLPGWQPCLLRQDVPDAGENLPRPEEAQKRFSRHSFLPVFMRPRGRSSLANVRDYIGHSLTSRHTRPRDFGAHVRRCLDDGIPPAAGLIDVLRLQGHPHAACRLVGLVDRVVAPPGAVSVGR